MLSLKPGRVECERPVSGAGVQGSKGPPSDKRARLTDAPLPSGGRWFAECVAIDRGEQTPEGWSHDGCRHSPAEKKIVC
jgi:hypothetical protein